MNSESIQEVLCLSGLLMYYVTPSATGEVIILREYDKGYLGVYRDAAKALELNTPMLNAESKALHAKLSTVVAPPKKPAGHIQLSQKIAPKPKRK